MSIEIRARIICDTCGAVIEGPVETSATLGLRTYWRAMDEAKKRHWLTLPRYGKHKHLCQPCADGVPATAMASPSNAEVTNSRKETP
jgi:hypothetical protein